MARSLSRETVGGSESPNSGMPLADAFRYRGAAGLEHEDLAGDVGIDVGLGQKGADLAARDALDHFREGGLHCALEGQPRQRLRESVAIAMADAAADQRLDDMALEQHRPDAAGKIVEHTTFPQAPQFWEFDDVSTHCPPHSC